MLLFLPRFELNCFLVLQKDDPDYDQLMQLHRHFVLLKLFDFIGTIFFVLRKKSYNALRAHVYHHSIMFSLSLLMAKYYPTIGNGVVGCTNAYVHFVSVICYIFSTTNRNGIWLERFLILTRVVSFLKNCGNYLYNSFQFHHYTVFFYYLEIFFNQCQVAPKFLYNFGLINHLVITCLFTKIYIKYFIKKI